MNITLISVGGLKEDYLERAMAEYTKRIGAYARWDEVHIKEEKLTDESPAAVRAALAAEGQRIAAALPRDAFCIALCVEGKMLSSEAFAQVLGKARDEGGKVCFVIGSSWGLDARVKEACDLRLSFSSMTFPHTLMRVILAEGVYRALTILAGKRYHK